MVKLRDSEKVMTQITDGATVLKNNESTPDNRYRNLFENALEAILLADDNAKYIDANPAACGLLGYQRSELLDLHLWNITTQSNQVDGLKLWQDFIKTGTQTGEYQLTTKDGKTIAVEYRAVANFLPGQHLSFLRDITTSRKATAETHKLQAELAHVARISTVGEMASGLAHEINQPLSAINNYAKGCIKRLENEEIDTNKLSQTLVRIAAQAERAADVVRNLREFVSKGELQGETADINELIQEALVLEQTDARQSGVAICCNLSPNLPEVIVDRIQIQQVVLNLIRNSVEALVDKGTDNRLIEINTNYNDESTGIIVEICDNGPGLDQEILDHLFEPFYTTKPLGMGMGLAISNTIIENHGGLMSAKQNGDNGLTVQFTLPLEKK